MRFELGVRTSNVTTNQAIAEIIAGNKGCRVKAFTATLATAVTGVFGVGRPAVKGVTPTTPTNFQPIDGPGDASLSSVALAWGTSPTVPTNFFSRLSAPATIGALFSLVPSVFSHAGIFVPAGGTLVLFNITGGPTLDLNFDIDE